MERRREVRVSLGQKVRVTVLGRNGRQMEGRADDLSNRGIRILMPATIAPGDAVKIDLEDAILLGEVCYCQPHDGGFITGVQLDQALSGLAELARLNEALLQDVRSSSSSRCIDAYALVIG